MKNLIIKIAILTAIVFGLSGCGQKFTEDRLLVNGNSTIKDNSTTKVYYKDINLELLKESLEYLANDLNNSEIIPPYTYTIVNPTDAKKQYKYNKVVNSEGKKIKDITFKLNPNKNGLVYVKNYQNMIEVYEEVEALSSYFRKLLESKENRDKYNTSKINFDIFSIDLRGAALKTEFAYIYHHLAKDIKKQIELGGWQMVDSPEKADKEIYFELSRDYYPKEIDELKKSKKGIRFVSLESGNKFNIQGNNNSNHVVVGQSAMNLASGSNGDLTSVAIGLTTAAIFSLFGDSTPEKEYSGAFVSLKIIDKVKKNVSIKLYDSYLDNYKVDTRYDLLKKINCNFGNIDSNFLEICLKNYNSKKLLLASFAQLLYRLANLDFISSAKKIGGKIRQIVGVASNPVNSNQLQGLNIRLSLRNYRIYDLNEKPFVMDTKIDIAQKLVKLNLKGLDVIKVAQITELPLKKVEKMYREAFIK